MSALSLIASVCVLCLMRRSVIRRPSHGLRRVMTVLARLFCVKHEHSSSEAPPSHQPELGASEEENKLLVMTTLNARMLQHDGQNCSGDNRPDVQKNTFNAVDSTDRRNDVVAMLERIRREVRSELKVLTRATREKEEEDVATKEWSFVANVIDRMLFCLFFVGNVILLSAFIWHRPGEVDTCGFDA